MTSRCNLRCRTCLYPSYEERWIRTDLSSELFDRIPQVAGRCDSLHLQGWGETLLREDTARRILDITNHRGRLTLSSNGTRMTDKMARQLIDNGLGSMTFSLAGLDAAINDALRGIGTFSATLSGIHTFIGQRPAKAKPPVLINYLLTPDSFPRLPKALALSSRLGVDTLVATHLVHTCTDDPIALASYGKEKPYAWTLFRSRWAVLWRQTHLILPGERKKPTPVCSKDPIHNLFVGADGAVSPCVYLCPPIRGSYRQTNDGKEKIHRRLVMGDLSKNSLDEIWQVPEYVAFRDRYQRRLDIYESIMPPVRTDFEGLAQLEQAVRKIETFFASPEFEPPNRCRGCSHLMGY